MRYAVIAVVLLAACKRESAATQAVEVEIDAAAVVEVNVEVRVDGGLAIDGRTLKDDAELESSTRALAQQKPVLHAVIHVDEGVPYDRVIEAEHALKRGGAAHMTFAVRGDASSPIPTTK